LVFVTSDTGNENDRKILLRWFEVFSVTSFIGAAATMDEKH
jgi:hypothetical protein